jgi:hypothetical protein
MKYLLLIPVWLLACAGLRAQEAENYNIIHDEDITSVQIHLAGAPISMPIVELRCPDNALVLQFDHLGDALHDYGYKIRHCNADWSISDLDDNEFVDGFSDERINMIETSQNTLTPYTHYTLGLPNRFVRWNKSGNYLLYIYDNEDDKRLVLVRRFMVIEPLWKTEAVMTQPARVAKLYSHQELDFSMQPKNIRVNNPQNDVKAYVLQNGRWDNVVGPVKPYATRGEQILFDYQDVVVFPAGKEFRFFDMRSLEFRGEFVRTIVRQKDYYEVTLQTDQARSSNNAGQFADANGHFVIENRHQNQGPLQCEYASVLFSLAQNLPFEDQDVYVFGELSDWQLKPAFKMQYSPEAQAYYLDAFLKQGYYNYIYVLLNRDTNEIDPEGVEGNWHETGNQYTILVYYRPFGERYDRLVSTQTIDSRLRN